MQRSSWIRQTGARANRAPVWFCMLLALLLAGCGEPIPPDKISYIGDWQTKDMRLAITGDSRVEYWRKTGNSTTSINAPIRKWEGNHFHVGIGSFASTKFEVSKPPAEKDGVWTMTVDGVELTRIGPGAQWTDTKPEKTRTKPGENRDLRTDAGTSPAQPQSASRLHFSYS
jgi:hypothetical protein